VPAEDPNEIIDRFRAAITDQTRLILASHVINISGQVLPVKEIAAVGRARGIPVIIDGAHAFAHLDFTLAELDCDYYATSLHKWLFAPHGTGLLYVRRDRIRDTWPLMAAEETQDDDIRKFEQIGTHPAANTLAIAEALTFHQSIGNARKLQRLLYLRDYWAQRLIENDRVQLHTSLKPGAACAIATVNIEGVDPGDLTRHLWVNHRIIVTPVKHEQFQGIRVTPSVYTTLPELDRFCDAMGDVMVNGV
jgi:selenocysteine lyase/cysteine desulfurase